MCGVARTDDRGRRRRILVGMFPSVVLSRSSSTLHIASPQPILPLYNLSFVPLEPDLARYSSRRTGKKIQDDRLMYVAVPASRFPCVHWPFGVRERMPLEQAMTWGRLGDGSET